MDHKELHIKTMALFVIKQRLRQTFETSSANPLFLGTARGKDLDLLAAMLGIFRRPFESDHSLRKRLKAEAGMDSGGDADG